MTQDTGGAPHCEDGFLSLVRCKPGIRKQVKIGDMVIGINKMTQKNGFKKDQIMFMARGTKILTMTKYTEENPERNQREIELTTHCHDEQDHDDDGKYAFLSTDFILFGSNHIDCPEWMPPVHRNFQTSKGNGKNRGLQDKFHSFFEECKIKYGTGKIGNHMGKL